MEGLSCWDDFVSHIRRTEKCDQDTAEQTAEQWGNTICEWLIANAPELGDSDPRVKAATATLNALSKGRPRKVKVDA